VGRIGAQHSLSLRFRSLAKELTLRVADGTPFCGKSQPNNKAESSDQRGTRELLSPEQAMADYVMLLRYINDWLLYRPRGNLLSRQ
jgi:hypothetical protein